MGIGNAYPFNAVAKAQQVVVSEPSALSGTLDSSLVYFIDGIIDMGTQSIEIPAGGLHMIGYDFDNSKLISSESSYTMFTSPAGGSGPVLFADFSMSVTGTTSQVFNIEGDLGTEAFELFRNRFLGCTSLGTVKGYAQGLEFGTGRFGGKPSLTLDGVWSGGYRVTTTIARGIDNGMTDAFFKAGATFSMSSRFLSDANFDLGTLAPFIDFSASNFPNHSTVQLQGCIITRNGVADPTDSTIIPNITEKVVESAFSNNIGIQNTFVGGRCDITSTSETTISTIDVYVDLAGTFAASDLQHFDSPSNGQLRHIGTEPRDYLIIVETSIEGTGNDVLELKLTKFDDSGSSFSEVQTQIRPIIAFTGPNDTGFYRIEANVVLDTNDYVKLEIRNTSGTANVTANIDTYLLARER